MNYLETGGGNLLIMGVEFVWVTGDYSRWQNDGRKVRACHIGRLGQKTFKYSLQT